MQRLAFLTATVLMFFGAATLGCIKETSSTGGGETATTSGEVGHDHGDHDHAGHDHAHEHAAHGPHGGHLIELADGKYHAEWTHDDLSEQENAKNVTIYILGEDAKTEVPIEAEQITINVSGGKEPKQYELAAVNAQDGKASQFSLDEPALVVDLGMAGEGVEAKLNVKIEGTPYSAAIAHDHEHDHAH
jgi:hypothetical protein